MNHNYIFDVDDKSGRKIHLTRERWSYIRKKHPEVETPEEIEEVIKKPDITKAHPDDKGALIIYKYNKNKPISIRYLTVMIKYLNGTGFVVTAYGRRNTK